MSAPALHPPSSSVSSSGHVDGLGRRVLAFDRETGGMLERLYVRPELAAFETVLRANVEKLLTFDDERFARPFGVDHDPGTGELTVLSEFVAGSRVADLLDTAYESSCVPGVDVALGYLLEALPALSAFHSGTGMAHGLIEPSRTVVTSAGQVVFLDCAFGSAIERLGLAQTRLWSELGIAAQPSAAGRVRLDPTADVAQVALTAVMLVLGRRLGDSEYPDALPSLLMEIVEVAQIRRSSTFASALQRILQRSLPLPGRRAFGTPDEVLVEVRQLVRREIGLDVCRQALMDFVAQMDAVSISQPGVDDLQGQAPYGTTSYAETDPYARAFDEALAAAGIGAGALEDGFDAAAHREAEDSAELELELRLDEVTPSPMMTSRLDPHDTPLPDVIEIRADIEDVFELDTLASSAVVPPIVTGPASDLRPDRWSREDLPPLNRQPSWDPGTAAPATDRLTDGPAAHRAAEPEGPPEPEPELAPAPITLDVAPAPGTAAAVPDAAPPVTVEPTPVLAPPPLAQDAPGVEEVSTPSERDVAPTVTPELEDAEDQPESSSSRRRKRQQRSARAKKDKLRSVTSDQRIGSAKPAAPPTPKAAGWIVSPDKAAAFDPPVAEQQAAAARPSTPAPASYAPPSYPPPTFPPPPPSPAFSTPAPPAVAPPVAPPIAVTPPMPVFNPPAPPTPVPLQPKPVIQSPAPSVRPAAPAPATGGLRLKTDAPTGYTPVRKRLPPDPPPQDLTAYRGATFPVTSEPEAGRSFPWKLAAAVLIIVAAVIGVGRYYLWVGDTADESATVTEAAGPEPPATGPGPAAATGEIVIETQPAGARVLLDGKPVGETPLKLPGVAAGRHTLTFITSSGEFKRTVRVAAGKTLTLDVPLFSGWVAIFAPILLDVAEDGRAIGSTEQNRLLLPPGSHKLTLSNRDLGYTIVKEVEIQAGEVYSVTLDPRGPVNFNAVPWAEVWYDNQKIGDTPVANFEIPLGLREFVFKHPQYGERRVTATVRGDGATAVSADFTKP
ncbi:MAG TPA: PEGA domain-containing protein [Vicinamibacterales bacterium]|nr:PEGA domain-containing protein [Vicinamibacterales bacterium]